MLRNADGGRGGGSVKFNVISVTRGVGGGPNSRKKPLRNT